MVLTLGFNPLSLSLSTKHPPTMVNMKANSRLESAVQQWSLWLTLSVCLPSTCCCVPFSSETHLYPHPRGGCQVMETFPPSQLPSWGTDPNPKIFCLFLNLYLLPYLILRRLACLFGSLKPSTSMQNVLWRSCFTCRWIFDVFWGRNVIFPYYSFAILKIPTSFLLIPFSFILLFSSYFYHSIFQLTYLFFCLSYSAVYSF